MGGWRRGGKRRDVVTNRILPRFFCKKGVTKAVTSRVDGRDKRVVGGERVSTDVFGVW